MAPKVMTCQESSGNLLARFRQELSPADSTLVEGHLAGCDTCRREETEIAALAALISSLPEVEPSTDSWSRLLRMIEEPQSAGTAPVSRKPGRLIARTVFTAAVLAAALAAACLLLILLPTATPVTLIAGPGELLLNGAPLHPSNPIELGEGALIEAGTLALAGITTTRSITMDLAAGTRVTVMRGGHFRILDGRAFVTVMPGEHPVRFYASGDTFVEVTGTAFDIVVDGSNATATVAVAEGVVRVFTGRTPVRVIQGQSLVFAPAGESSPPVPVDPRRIRDWCGTPTALLVKDGSLLRLTLRNDTVHPLSLKPFDPRQATYSLLIESPEISLPVKIQERMVQGPAGLDQEIRTLAPGEGYDLLLDPEALALARGTYRVRAVYKPYPPLPAHVWHGPPLRTEALTITVE